MLLDVILIALVIPVLTVPYIVLYSFFRDIRNG